MRYILICFLLISLEAFSQTTVTRDTIRIPGTDSTTIVVSTKTTTVLTGTVNYTYPQTATVVTYYKIANATPPPNKPPVCSAGPNQTITLPINSVTLSGSATDSDGTIVAYLWEKTSGPVATIVSPTNVNTSVTNLGAGTYVFRLTVTDNGGAKASSSTTVTVNSQPPPVDTGAIKLEGFGSRAVGGSNSGQTFTVNTASEFVSKLGSNRTILFGADLLITGSAARVDLSNYSYLTIDANGHDITFDNGNAGPGFSCDGPGSHHIILRGLRVKNAGDDGMNVVNGAHDITITNCSTSLNRDDDIDIAADNTGATYNVTVQYSILGPGNTTSWNGASLVTGANVSQHHNLFISVTKNQVGERNSLTHASYSPVGNPNIDFRNNLVWLWGRNGGTGSGYGTAVAYNATGNIVNNYYYSNSSPTSAAQPNDGYGSNPGKAYIAGNFSGNTGVNANSKSNSPEFVIPAWAQITMQSACDAAKTVKSKVGPPVLNAEEKAWINSVTLPGCN